MILKEEIKVKNTVFQSNLRRHFICVHSKILHKSSEEFQILLLRHTTLLLRHTESLFVVPTFTG